MGIGDGMKRASRHNGKLRRREIAMEGNKLQATTRTEQTGIDDGTKLALRQTPRWLEELYAWTTCYRDKKKGSADQNW